MYTRSEDNYDDASQRPQQPTTATLEIAEAPYIFPISFQCPPLSDHLLPISPLFSGANKRERCPSVASKGLWEAASDIYDDYRYSRFWMASKILMSSSSRFSVNTGVSDAIYVTPPVPESRLSIDSNSRQRRAREEIRSCRGRDRGSTCRTHYRGCWRQLRRRKSQIWTRT